MVSVVVRGRMPGREASGSEVLVDLAPESTARELIGAVVAAQFAGQGAAVWTDCSRMYLTDDEIAAMAARGTVRLGGRDAAPPPPATAVTTVGEATAQAVAAYRRGAFVVFAGASQVDEIDEAVHLRDGDRVVFLRLTALVGG